MHHGSWVTALFLYGFRDKIAFCLYCAPILYELCKMSWILHGFPLHNLHCCFSHLLHGLLLHHSFLNLSYIPCPAFIFSVVEIADLCFMFPILVWYNLQLDFLEFVVGYIHTPITVILMLNGSDIFAILTQSRIFIVSSSPIIIL